MSLVCQTFGKHLRTSIKLITFSSVWRDFFFYIIVELMPRYWGPLRYQHHLVPQKLEACQEEAKKRLYLSDKNSTSSLVLSACEEDGEEDAGAASDDFWKVRRKRENIIFNSLKCEGEGVGLLTCQRWQKTAVFLLFFSGWLQTVANYQLTVLEQLCWWS